MTNKKKGNFLRRILRLVSSLKGKKKEGKYRYIRLQVLMLCLRRTHWLWPTFTAQCTMLLQSHWTERWAWTLRSGLRDWHEERSSFTRRTTKTVKIWRRWHLVVKVSSKQSMRGMMRWGTTITRLANLEQTPAILLRYLVFYGCIRCLVKRQTA